MTRAEIVATALRDPAAAVRERGGDPRTLFDAARLPAAAEDRGSIPLGGFVAFSQIAAERLGAADFGWRAGRRFDIENLGALGRAALRAPTLGDALVLMRDAFAAVQGASELDLTVADGEAALTYRILDPDIWPREQDAALTLGVVSRLIEQAAAGAFLHIAFEQGTAPRARGALVAAPCTVSYDAPGNTLHFGAGALRRPMPLRDPEAFRALALEVRRRSRETAAEAPLPARVRRTVLARLGNGGADQTEVAAALGMTRRTLRRKLESAGLSFSEIVADCRQRAAFRLLDETAMPIVEIAATLGYSDQSAFERAFRKRAGQTPAQRRRAPR